MKKNAFLFLLVILSVLVSASISSADSGKLYPIGQHQPPNPGPGVSQPWQKPGQPQQPKPEPWQQPSTPWQQPQQPWQQSQPPKPEPWQQPQPWQQQPQKPEPWQPQQPWQQPQPPKPEPWQQPQQPQRPSTPSQDRNVSVTTQRSYNNSINLTWTIRNVTNEDWGSSNVDILCTAGCHLLTNRDRYRWDLPYTVKRNGMLSFTVNIQPYRSGETMTFAMVAGKQTLYSFNVRL